MDRPLFLNSSGAIISRIVPAPAAGGNPLSGLDLFDVVPYVEEIPIPELTIDQSAVYGDHPENLVTLTTSNGAALTFFVDSDPGGSNTGGNGSFDDPWRSLNTASAFLACAECTLRAAVKYVQLKIKGDAGYVSGAWSPFSYAPALILAGWGERRDLGAQASYGAGYMFNLAGKCAYTGGVYSNCIISGGTLMQYQSAISCEMSGGGYTQYPLDTYSVMYDCRVSGAPIWTRYCYRCELEYQAGVRPFYSWYYYDTTITVQAETATTPNVRTLCYVRSAAVDTRINASILNTLPDDSYEVYYDVFGIPASSSVYLRNCSAYMAIAASRSYVSAFLFSGYDDADRGVVIDGGGYTILNSNTMVVNNSTAAATAAVRGAVSAVVRNADFHLTASATASALVKSSGWWSELEVESTTLFANSCRIRRERNTSGTSTTSSGTCPVI